jgi:excisionase family DNA binding protein
MNTKEIKMSQVGTEVHVRLSRNLFDQINKEEGVLTYEEAAQYLKVSVAMIKKLVATRQLKAAKIGSSVRIAPSELHRFLQAAQKKR